MILHWFRRDLRISDNTALSEAARTGRRVIPVFIMEDALRTGPDVGAARLGFLLQSVDSLRKNLAELGCPLIIRQGRSEDLIPLLCRETGATAVYANKRYEPYAQARDRRLGETLFRAGVEFKLYKDAVAWEETEILTQAEKPYTVFTPYSKAWKQRIAPSPKPQFKPNFKGEHARPGRGGTRPRVPHFGLAASPEPNPPSDAPAIKSDPLPLDPVAFGHPLTHPLPPAGERAARETLRKFMAGPVLQYSARRDYPAEAGTSQLSPHLRAGTIGIRTIFRELHQARATATPVQAAGCDVFLNELIWREFYLQVLHNFPHVLKGAFRPEYNQLKWSDNQDHFQAWCSGQTGYPIVDAAMRCLNATGTMHNRLRMIVAMFLTKDLLINWQWGERYFMQKLLDGDLAANNGGWQWSAGTGTDAAPYFRIFNPVSQSEKFDPEGKFIRHWLPELSIFPTDDLHQPWAPPLLLSKSKYPARIVLHEEQRERCLAMFKAVK